ncbi:helicase-related protein, partial [Kurthia senegalensis]
MLFELIRRKVNNGKRLLVFIQNKGMIEHIKSLLDDIGINTAAVTSDGKKDNPAYLSLVNESRFPNEVKVILTTSVLSDGININNENNNYECILVASRHSSLFDVAQTRQCANRFRNTYQSFIVYMLTPKRKSDYLYNIENAYNYEHKLATNAVQLLNTEFEGKDSFKLMRMGILERRYGIKLDDNYKAYYNPLNL